MEKIIKLLANGLGYDIKRKEIAETASTRSESSAKEEIIVSDEIKVFEAASTGRALERACKRGLSINTVIDIGASNGMWSEECMRYLPDANYYLIDANGYHVEALDNFCVLHKNARYVIAAAGTGEGECFFDNSDNFGGMASSIAFGKAKTKTKMVSADSIVAKFDLKAPYLLKLDTHGFEQSILKGAESVLKNAELVVIESYIFKLEGPETITFDELCHVMDSYGFRVGDFSEPMWREKDMMLWQWDLFFFKKNNVAFEGNSYR